MTMRETDSVLVGMQVREDLAKSLTAAILKQTGRREHSALERIECQLVSGLFL